MIPSDRDRLTCCSCGRLEPVVEWKQNTFYGALPLDWLAVSRDENQFLCPNCWIGIGPFIYDRHGEVLNNAEEIERWSDERRQAGEPDTDLAFLAAAQNTWARRRQAAAIQPAYAAG